MKADPAVLDALNECLKWERTLAACLRGYHEYFERWRVHRTARWFADEVATTCARIDALCDRIVRLDSTPSQDAYEFELVEMDSAEDIKDVYGYFLTTLDGARSAYETARGACKDVDDSVSAGVAKRGKTGVEDVLERIEAKLKRIDWVGPELYLAVHFHDTK